MSNRVRWRKTIDGNPLGFPSVVSIMKGEVSPHLSAKEMERATSGADPLGELIEADATATGEPKTKPERGKFSIDKPASPAKE